MSEPSNELIKLAYVCYLIPNSIVLGISTIAVNIVPFYRMELEHRNDVLGNGDSITKLSKGLPMTVTTSTAATSSSVAATISPAGASSTSASASGTPTPPDAILDKTWAVAYDNIGGCEEQRQLLGTEEESSDKHSSDGETDVADADPDDDVWILSAEQHHYYETQFKQLQPDVNGLINGYEARTYFEKSKLPVHELRKIWQLSDITKDGALSLPEFKIAMHLVVLRRNNIRLPDTLPQSLVDTIPVVTLNVDAVNDVTAPSGTGASFIMSATTNNNSESLISPQQLKGGQEWTKFVDSPSSETEEAFSSLVKLGKIENIDEMMRALADLNVDGADFHSGSVTQSSQPVNFDFLRPSVEQNPKILHPVAVRATPGLDNIASDDFKNIPVTSFVSDSYNVEGNGSSNGVPLKSIQRPQPKKYAVPGPGALPPPPTTLADELPTSGNTNGLASGPTSLPVITPSKKEPPPPPPPRPSKTHFRSSSLDLNRLGKIAVNSIPSIPPRTSPNSCVNPTLKNVEDLHLADSLYHGAFHVYKRNSDAKSSQESQSTEKKASVPEICMDEKNRYLRKVCQELQEELSTLRQERVALQMKLEKLHSRSPQQAIHLPA